MNVQVLQNEWKATPEATLGAIEKDLGRAAFAGSDFVVLPEHALGKPGAEPLDRSIRERTLDVLSTFARRQRTYVATGSWLEERDGKLTNAARVLDREGTLIATVLRAQGNGESETGDDFPVFDTDLGKVGLLLGQDFWMLETTRIQSLRGAELILVSGSVNALNREAKLSAIWGIATLSCVAVAFASAVGLGGRHAPRGGSTIALPNRVLSQAGDRPTHLAGEWDNGTMRQLREADLTFKNTLWFGLWARRRELYGPLTTPTPQVADASEA
jgi:predicted amidohydrolase